MGLLEVGVGALGDGAVVAELPHSANDFVSSYVCCLFEPLVQPVDDGFVPLDGVVRLQDPVVLVGEV